MLGGAGDRNGAVGGGENGKGKGHNANPNRGGGGSKSGSTSPSAELKEPLLVHRFSKNGVKQRHSGDALFREDDETEHNNNNNGGGGLDDNPDEWQQTIPFRRVKSGGSVIGRSPRLQVCTTAAPVEESYLNLRLCP